MWRVLGIQDLHLPSQIQFGGMSRPDDGLQEFTVIIEPPPIEPARRR